MVMVLFIIVAVTISRLNLLTSDFDIPYSKNMSLSSLVISLILEDIVLM